MEFPGRSAGLLPQLPDGGLGRVLPVLQLSRRDLPQDLPVGVTELGHQQGIVVAVQGQHPYAAGVVHHLSGGGVTVGQEDRVPPNVEDTAVKDLFTGQGFFRQFHSGASFRFVISRRGLCQLWRSRRFSQPPPPADRRPDRRDAFQ